MIRCIKAKDFSDSIHSSMDLATTCATVPIQTSLPLQLHLAKICSRGAVYTQAYCEQPSMSRGVSLKAQPVQVQDIHQELFVAASSVIIDHHYITFSP
jgi:hypothetical protein